MKKLLLTLSLGLFVTPITNAQELPSYVPTDGLVAYYPFNGNANDASGNGYHGTVNGATLANDQNGNENKAYEFIVDQGASWGSPQHEIEIGFNSSMNSNFLTLSAWVNPRVKPSPYNDRSHSIFGRWDGGVSNEIFRFVIGNDNALYFQINDGNNNIENYYGGNIPFDSWTHVAAVLNDKNIKLYVNGQMVSDELFVNNINITGNSDLTIASMPMSNGTWYFFDGYLDEMGYWNRALTEQEIQNLFTSSTGDILLNGVVSAENNQIKNLEDPTHPQDAVTKRYTDTKFYTQSEVDALISNLQNQIAILKGDPIDNEGNIYTFKTFGTQTWTTEPAAMETYRDGTVIPQVDSTSDWANLTTGAWCYNENDSSKVKLYNWYAVVGIHDAASLTDVSLRKEFAPEGWHVPSNDELITLIDYFISSGYNYDSTTSLNKIAKAVASKTGWITSNVDGTPGNNSENNNSTGFNLHPHGYRTNTGGFGLSSQAGFFWTVDDAGGGNSVGTLLVYNSVSLGYANSPYAATYSKPFGLSVRLVKD